MKIALFGNTYQTEKSHPVIKLFEQLNAYHAEVYVCRPFYNFLGSHLGFEPAVKGLFDGSDFDADLAISIGGDGTFLNTVERVGPKGIPILGINTGRLGFLADISENEIEQAIPEIFNNHFTIEKRFQLRLETDGDLSNDSCLALNEIAVMKQDSSSMISIHAWLNEQYLNTYQADGLIVSTPTGSTAYAMSVGGPIIVPESNNIIIAPIAPHSLTIRPLVIPDNLTITMQVESRNNHFLVALDGRSHVVKACKLKIERASSPVLIAKRKNQSYFDTLRAKLMWGADKRSFPL